MTKAEIIKAELNSSDIEQLEAITLFFFAYRDFIADADRFLVQFEFGRAHHRVLFFVSRKPGMTVAELLDILGITKQSLSRVLKDLIDNDFIHQKTDDEDKRKRLLYTTNQGRDLVLDLADKQSARISMALKDIPTKEKKAVLSFLRSMIGDEGHRLLKNIE